MPCRVDVYEPSEQEREHGRAARCLLFIMESVTKEDIPVNVVLAEGRWEMGCGAGYKGFDWVEELCDRLTQLGERKVHSIVMENFDNPIAPMIHQWWIAHKKRDLKKKMGVPVVVGFGPSLWKNANIQENVVPVGAIRFGDADGHEEQDLPIADGRKNFELGSRTAKRLIFTDLTFSMDGLMKNLFNSRERDDREPDDFDLLYGPVGVLITHPGEDIFGYYFNECYLRNIGEQKMSEGYLLSDKVYAQYATFTMIPSAGVEGEFDPGKILSDRMAYMEMMEDR